MPTGYPADLYEGKPITFKQFVLNCARAFGALVTMRDESPDAPIPEEFKPSTYHKEQVEKELEELKQVKSWNKYCVELQANDEFERQSRRRQSKVRQDVIDNSKLIEARYNAMLEKVEAWKPPSEEHNELKIFMIEQLKKVIKFDCDHSFLVEPIKISDEEFKQKEIERLEKSIMYHQIEYKKEVERITKQNKWINDLRNSLKED